MNPPNPNIKVTAATSSVFRAEDVSDNRFFVIGTVGAGLLRFEVVRRLTSTGEQSSISGSEFFDAMMAHFGAAVRAIEGHWSNVNPERMTNLVLFNRAAAAGLSPEQAALVATKTGQWADAYGFSKVVLIDLDPPNTLGNSFRAVVRFEK